MMEEDLVFESKEDEESEKDILEIIEELPEDPQYQSYNNNTVVQEQDDNQEQKEADDSPAVAATAPRPSEFSLSSIKFSMIGDALHGSAVNLGSATASLFQEAQSKIALKLPSPNSNGDVNNNNNSNHNSASSNNRSLLSRLAGSDHYSTHNRGASKVQFGELECRASRLRYTQEDIFNIVDDRAQFDELRNALRSLGAVTNNVLQQKLHWYVKNSKRERARLQQEQLEREQQQQQQQLLALQQQQQQQKQQQLAAAAAAAAEQQQLDLGPVTPPTETKVVDSDKILQSAAESMRKMTGVSLEKDPSPKSVRGIFVPAS